MNNTIEARTLLFTGLVCFASFSIHAQPQASAQPPVPIPMDQLGAVAGKQYLGDGLAIRATPNGARLHCVFQRLEGEATSDGLWLSSTAEGVSEERFRVVAVEVGRTDDYGVRRRSEAATPLFDNSWLRAVVLDSESGLVLGLPSQSKALPVHGAVLVEDRTASFIRPGLTEEYSVSVDGVRQDFIVQQRPAGDGKLRVELEVTGATAESLPNGARLTLINSGRKLAYSRLHVTDARGRELTARIEVASENRVAVLVDDGAAVYPIRIDPTFSDDNWISMGGSNGADDEVSATVVDGSGKLYIGGRFTTAGGHSANYIAKWDGNGWSALGSGMNAQVHALAVSGSDVYAGGDFTTAGGTPANYIAKWDGSRWSALGSGMVGGNFPFVRALAVSGSDVYVGGWFTTAGGSAANYVAKWNGSSWSALGSGMNAPVHALAVSGNDVYAGGYFTTAGGTPANSISKWNGNAWVALGSGLNGWVNALAVSGSDVYAGGLFPPPMGIDHNYIAKWNGSVWATLDSGVNHEVRALAVSGGDLYAGGDFTKAGGTNTFHIAKWDGSSWSALGSGMNGFVSALAVSGSDVYAGGNFTTAGGKVSTRIARANIGENVSPGQFGSSVFSPVAGFTFTFSGGTVGQSYRIQKTLSLVGPWTDLTNFVYLGPIIINDASAIASTNSFYRAVSP